MRKLVVFAGLSSVVAGVILAVQVMQLMPVMPLIPVAHAAVATSSTKAIRVGYVGDTVASSGGHFYSRASSLVPVQTGFDLRDYGVDPAQVLSVTMTADQRQTMAAVCTTEACTLSSVSGIATQVKAVEHKRGSFAWWRNGPGWHGYWWSYDTEKGGTTYAQPEIGPCGAAPCEYPDGLYDTHANANWKLLFYDQFYQGLDPLTGANFSIDGHAVLVDAAASVVSNTSLSKVVTQGQRTNSVTGEGGYTTADGPFAAGGSVEYTATGKGITWNYDFTIAYTGAVYVYPADWTIRVMYKAATPVVEPTPTATPGPSATPTPVATPGPTVAPTPLAELVVIGTRKEKRELTLDGSGSTSSALYPIVNTTRRFLIEPMAGASAGDIVANGSMIGAATIKVMFKKAGTYKVTYSVTNTLGYSSSKSILLTIEQDLPPTIALRYPDRLYRDPNNQNAAVFAVTDDSYSPDGDAVGARSAKVVRDTNDNGSFLDESNSISFTFNNVTRQGSFSVNQVGKYQIEYRICETFDAGVFASQLAPTDYRCETATFPAEVDNLPPSTGLSGDKMYKVDLAIAIGDLSPADQTAVTNSVGAIKTELAANQIDATITVHQWDSLAESDLQRDLYTFVNTGVSWRTDADQKLLFTPTQSLNTYATSTAIDPLNIKPISLANIDNVISAKAYNGVIYVIYKSYMGSSTSDYYYKYAKIVNGSVVSEQFTGFQWTSNDNYPYNAIVNAYKDTLGRPYWIFSQEYDNQNTVFYHKYYLYSPDFYGTVKLNGDNPSGYENNQILSTISMIQGVPTLWRTSGIFYGSTFQQNVNIWSNANNWNPSPYSYGGGAHTYQIGWTAGSNAYWFSQAGSVGANGAMMSNYLEVNGGMVSWAYRTPVHGIASGNQLTVIAQDNAQNWRKITLSGSYVTASVSLGISGDMQWVAYNANTGRAIFANLYRTQIYEVDIINNRLIGTKQLPLNEVLLEVSFDSNNQTLYVFKNSAGTGTYASYESDTRPFAVDLMLGHQGPTMNDTVQYNAVGDAIWFENYGGSYGDSLSAVYKLDHATGEKKKVVFSNSGNHLSGVHLYPDGEALLFFTSRMKQNVKYARESEGYTLRDLSYLNTAADASGNISLVRDRNGDVYIVDAPAGSTQYLYAFHRYTGKMTSIGLWSNQQQIVTGTDVYGNAITQSVQTIASAVSGSRILSIEKKCNSQTNPTTCSWWVGGKMMIGSTNVTSWSQASADIDVDNNGLYVAVITGGPSGSCSLTNCVTYVDSNIPVIANKQMGAVLGYLNTNTVKTRMVNGEAYILTDSVTPKILSKISATQSSFSTSYNLQQISLLKNTINVTNWVPGTLHLSNAGYTTHPNLPVELPTPSYTVNADFSQVSKLFDRSSSLNSSLAGNLSEYNSLSDLGYDIETGTFGRYVAQSIFDNNANMYTSKVGYFYLYSPSTKAYKAIVCTICGTQYTYSLTGGMQPNVRGGNTVIGFVTNPVNVSGYQMYQSIDVFKATVNGVTKIYSLNAPSWNYFTGDKDAVIERDKDGYTYGIACYKPNYDMTRTCRIISDRSGSMAYYGIITATDSKVIAISDGNLVWVYQDYTGIRACRVPLNQLNSAESCRIIPNTSSYTVTAKKVYYDSQNDSFLLVGVGTAYSAKCNCTRSVSYLHDSKAHRIEGYDFRVVNDLIYVTIDGVGSFGMATINRKDFSYIDYGHTTGNAMRIFPTATRGQAIVLPESVLGLPIVYDFLNLSLTDANYANDVAGKGIRQVFAAPARLQEPLQGVIDATNGAFFDSSIGMSGVIRRLVDLILESTKLTGVRPNNYYTVGSTVNMKGIYVDYENDPMRESRYRFMHDPTVFDNSLGVAPFHNQILALVPNPFQYPGAYKVYFEAQDDPGLPSYRRWSKPSLPYVFYIHRKPIADFTITQHLNPAGNSTVLYTIKDGSYDPDHQWTDAAKGIVNWKWQWKLQSDGEWTPGLPPSTLTSNRTYMVSLVVTDKEGADSDPKVVIVAVDPSTTVPNTKPVVNVTSPSSAVAGSPTLYSTLRPTIYWTFTDADGDMQQKVQVYVYNISGTMVGASEILTGRMLSWTVPIDLAEQTTYYVQVLGYDGIEWSAPSTAKFFRIRMNQQPMATLVVTPSPLFVGDIATVGVGVFDPDGDLVSLQLDLSRDGGSYATLNTWNSVASGSNQSYTIAHIETGSYLLRLTFTDANGAWGAISVPFAVNDLPVSGMVSHTTEWEANRQQFNRANPNMPRSVDTFWAGERFMLKAQVPDTGTATVPSRVEAELVQTGDKVQLISETKARWVGELWTSSFVKLADGEYTMRFNVDWTNGFHSVQNVNVRIQDSLYGYFVTQLRN